MRRLPPVVEKLLNPPVWLKILIIIPSVAGLVYVLSTGRTDALAYVFYALSAYSLVLVTYFAVRTLPVLVRKIRVSIDATAEKIPFHKSYLTDVKTKGKTSLYGGAIADFAYAVFRLVTGVVFSSVWFLTLAGYHFVLLLLKIYLIISVKKENTVDECPSFGYNRYRTTAWFLFALNIPVGGIAALTVLTDSGFVYPGYVVYVSAIYAFYKIIWAIINVVRFRGTGSPVLSAAKVLNLVSAAVSIFGLQTAMITEFSSDGGNFRLIMNSVTGWTVILSTSAIAVYMIIKANAEIKKIKSREGFSNE